MVLVDTNILLSAINSDAPGHERCAAVVEDLMNGSERWALTWSVVNEFLRVSTHPRVFPRPLGLAQALKLLRGWTQSRMCHLVGETQEHLGIPESAAVESIRVAGNLVHDLHIAAQMREHGITDILTLDQDFRAFPWLRIRDLPSA